MQIPETKEYQLSDNMKLFIYGKSSNYKHPKNAALYSQDGVLKYWIEAPRFKSQKMIHGVRNEQHSRPGIDVWIIHPHKEKVKNFWGKVIEEKPLVGFFDAFTGFKEINGKEHAEIMISDGGMYFEFQYLDLETGRFIEEVNWGGRF